VIDFLAAGGPRCEAETFYRKYVGKFKVRLGACVSINFYDCYTCTRTRGETSACSEHVIILSIVDCARVERSRAHTCRGGDGRGVQRALSPRRGDNVARACARALWATLCALHREESPSLIPYRRIARRDRTIRRGNRDNREMTQQQPSLPSAPLPLPSPPFHFSRCAGDCCVWSARCAFLREGELLF